MNTRADTRRQETEGRIRELRESLDQLETQLQQDIERQQHDEIDHLDRHFNAVETKLSSLKTFWLALKDELSARRG